MLPFLETKNVDLFEYEFKNFAFPAHFHDGIEIICVENGEIALVVDGKRYVVRAGELAVVFPARIHSYEVERENSGFILILGRRLISEYDDELKGNVPSKVVFAENEIDDDCVLAAWRLRGCAARDIREQKAYAMLFLSRFLLSVKLEPAPAVDGHLLYPLVKYMETHFREDIRVTDVAAALYVNRNRIAEIFSHDLSSSFNDYLNSLRINYAVRLMDLHPELNLNVVSDRSGFTSFRTFARAFEKRYGVAPSKFKSGKNRT